ncbi:hypothetical protein K2W90_04205 [Candidatus Babeliales bacterium]|nr:hypothetical protein [Candidatus Babeliales bacterium]
MKRTLFVILSVLMIGKAVPESQREYSAQEVALMQVVAQLVQEGKEPEEILAALQEEAEQEKQSFVLSPMEQQVIIGVTIYVLGCISGYVYRWATGYKRYGGCNRDCCESGLRFGCSRWLCGLLCGCMGCHHGQLYEEEHRSADANQVNAGNQASSTATTTAREDV